MSFKEILQEGMDKGRVVFVIVDVFFHDDPARRLLTDITLPEELPFFPRQIKVLDFHDGGVREGRPVGNHWHPKEGCRTEFFVAVGKEDRPLFRFVWKESGQLKETEMRCGDACLIPPGVSHAFVPMLEGAQLWGYSNIKHNPQNDIPDVVIPVPGS